MDPMQAEALRRAQEMHSRSPSHNFTHNRDTHRESEQNNSSRNIRNEDITKSDTPADSHKSSTNPDGALVPTLFEDKEKLLILVLILLLLSENSADTSVILALLYLII